jgi:hypothetical protein
VARIYDGALEALSTRPDIVALLGVFKGDFDVTWVRSMHLYGTQVYAILLSPEKHIRNGFGLDSELLMVYHQYASVQPRLLHVVDKILSESPCQGRAEPMAFVLLTSAHDAKNEVRRLLADSTNQRVIIPFEHGECKDAAGEFFIRNRLAEFFFSRDLFDMSRPLASDLYFFGRHAFVLALRDLLKSGENLGLFGLRRTGKTSILLRLQRIIEESKGGKSIYFDLEDSALYQLRWWKLLERIAEQMPGNRRKLDFSEENASDQFRAVLEKVGKNTKVVVALDEIEHITPGERLRMRPHWDEDFIALWKTIRSVQNANRQVSFVVCGTNAAPVETASFDGRDNPLFGMVTKRYMPAFNRDEVRQMTRTLGRFMGLSFEEDSFDYLLDRYGGHPFITRQACSRVFESATGKSKPVSITSKALSSDEVERDLHLFAHAENVLSVLQRWYPLEYEMLEYLAENDVEAFSGLEKSIPDLSAHLRAYGLVVGNPPELSMQFVANFLRNRKKLQESLSADRHKGKIENLDSSGEDDATFARLAQLGFYRNRVEVKLRRFIRRILISSKGPARWIDPVLSSLPTERRDKLAGVDRDVILREHLYLLDLLNVVVRNWSNFNHLESQPGQSRVSKSEFQVLLDFLNKHREDAHAKDVSESTLSAVVLAANTIESAIDPYLSD